MATPATISADLSVQNHGSIFLIKGTTPEGKLWLDEHIKSDEPIMWGDAYVVEHRYIAFIVEGAFAEGYTVEVE